MNENCMISCSIHSKRHTRPQGTTGVRVPMCPQICTLKEPASVAATDQAMEHVMLALQVTHVIACRPT
jgi:hypothetical protein